MTTPQNLDFTSRIRESRNNHTFEFGFRDWTDRFTSAALALLFPHFSSRPKHGSVELEMEELGTLLCEALEALSEGGFTVLDVRRSFLEALPTVYDYLLLDAKAFYESDPAAASVDEVIFAYPGFYAISIQRLSHILYIHKVPFLPRLLSEHAHSRTGIDIHPGAVLGKSLFIDHGTGIVIGETAVVGDRVKIYQGATLGAHFVSKKLSGVKRHPTIEDDVMIYSHATVLGGNTVVGAGSVIGANSWVTRSIPKGSVVSHRTTVQLSKEQPPYDFIDFNI